MNNFIKKIKNSFQILSEVDVFSIEERIQNYETHKSIDNDVLIYEQMAIAYHKFCSLHPAISLDQKKEVFSTLVKMTMGMEHSDVGEYLDKKEIIDLKGTFEDTVLKIMQSF